MHLPARNTIKAMNEAFLKKITHKVINWGILAKKDISTN